MAVATPLRTMHDEDGDPDFVPASSWAGQGLAPRGTPAACDLTPMQYGPLTAQGNYLSHLDHVHWPSSQPANGASDLPAASFATDASIVPGVYEFLPPESTLDPAAAGAAWGEYADDALQGPQYGVYGEPIAHVSAYQHVESVPQLFAPANASEQPVGGPAHVDTSKMVGPWDGIWAFNPKNVVDNYVYPVSNMHSTTPVDRHAAPTISEDATLKSLPLLPAATRHQRPARHSTPRSTKMQVTEPFVAIPTMLPRVSAFEESLPTPAPASGTPAPTAPTLELGAGRPAPKTLKPERTKRNKAAQTMSLVPRRQGPLTAEQREKADDMRYYGACWRCRRYKKPCNGPGECDTCRTSGFRVWPSTLGCYRGTLDQFVIGVMPGNAASVMRDLSPDHAKVPNWKFHFGFRPELSPLPLLLGEEDRYTKLSVKLQATRMAGTGFVELFDVLANYQRSRPKPDVCLEHCCECLSYMCDVYHAFVVTDTSIDIPRTDLMSALTEFRQHYNVIWRHFLNLCLSGRRSAWLPAFLCACINAPLFVLIKDTFTAIPEPVRSILWPNITRLVEDLRTRLYPTGLDLLSVLTKGIKPWTLNCWRLVPSIDPRTKFPIPGVYERDPDGLRLTGGDTGAFDGFTGLQDWLERNRSAMYEGVSFLTTPPFSARNAKMQPIAVLAWMFDVAPPGKKVVNWKVVDDPDYVPKPVDLLPVAQPLQSNFAQEFPQVAPQVPFHPPSMLLPTIIQS